MGDINMVDIETKLLKINQSETSNQVKAALSDLFKTDMDIIYRFCPSYRGKENIIQPELILKFRMKKGEWFIYTIDEIGQHWATPIGSFAENTSIIKIFPTRINAEAYRNKLFKENK